MIKGFRHKGVKRFYELGVLSGIQRHHAKRVQLILTCLDASKIPQDINLPGLTLHKLTGELKDFRSVTVQKNRRIIFRFKESDAFDVNYIDYHKEVER